MNRRHCVSVTRASAASIMAWLAVLYLPAVGIAADPSGSTAEAEGRTSALLAPGVGYGQPQGVPHVRALQRSLRALGQQPGPVDGLYGPLTKAAVERLQRERGLAVDGIVGPQTRRVLNAKTSPLAPGAGYGQPVGSPQVRAVQRRLRALGQRPGPVDGLYGPRTQAAIERFQRTAGQPASGMLSPETAVALERADSEQSARRASDTHRGNEPRQRARHAASRPEASGADNRPRRTGGSKSAGGSDQSRTRIPMAADDRPKGTNPVLLVALVLALAAIGGLLAGWIKRRRRRPEASGLVGGPVRPVTMPKGGRNAAKPSTTSTAPSSTRPGRLRRDPVALGYVSVPEPEAVDGQQLRDQMVAIITACRQRGLVLKEVIRDLEQVNDTGPERPGMQQVLQRLAANEASCLVVAELGRLSRSAPEVFSLVGWLRRREARLVAVDQRLDTGTKSGAELADNLVSLCASDGRLRPLVRTGHPGPVPEQRPTERANGSSRPAKDEVAALKERIRAMRASGMTLQAIADRLNAEKVPTLRGGAMWRPSAVQAATGYRRPRPAATAPGNGGERFGNGSFGSRGRPRQPASSSEGGGTR